MISNQVLQSTIEGVKNISRIELCIIDIEGKELASTFSVEYIFGDLIDAFVNSPADSQVVQGFQFFKIFDENTLEYIVVAKGASEDIYMVGKLVAFQVQNLIIAYKERFDKDNFIKNLLLDNLLLVDIYNRAKKLHIDSHAHRVVFMIEINKEADELLEKIQVIFNDNTHDFLTKLDETAMILVKEVDETVESESLYHYATKIREMIVESYGQDARVSYGTIVSDIKDVSRSYKEAKMALDVGNIFYQDRYIVPYNNLGIGRIIYQLPVPLCRMFIKEIFGENTPDKFDDETLETIAKFFENSLNVSETARQLYIHRNTLVYRLDKLFKSTNLDIRFFDDAITFKIAMMVVRYMNYLDNGTERWR